jgi:hypothetical protein
MRPNRTLLIVLVLLSIILTLFAACERPQTPTVVDESRLVELERNPASDPPSREAEGLRRAAIVQEELVPAQVAKEPNCPFWVNTFVRAETGTNCDTYRAEIAGTAARCVKDCDDKARLAEAVASAQITCADFCKRKKCPGPRYQPPAKCAQSFCLDSKECDAVDCPKRNLCALLQSDRVWNCICLED